MFTGIVRGIATVVAVEDKNQFRVHTINMPDGMTEGLELGASVAHDGCCLSVTAINGDLVSFDLMKETLRITTLGDVKVGDAINVERAATFNAEIGGHVMSGHIMCTAEIVKVVATELNRQIWFRLSNKDFMKYVLYKGYIGVDGISLTIGEVSQDKFCVHLIPETLTRTTLGNKRLADRVNIEIDPQTQAVVDTVERVLAQRQAAADDANGIMHVF
ncbi:riboflavin synthase subunit alpha [Biostraticola tofi]|uniref:Riboflavin synthase n=1 Tax=Biostraticola tofi TaxID=466109 RepID=A0A4V2W5G6_9GAMM|nr:riboflavin synthase subunit alpha [Biostraticola tofi]TCV99745.1 riboflavin synthase alpha chain [Biostraticola tofi]